MKFAKLGDRVKDKISGFTGIVECETLWLNGCVRISIAPETLDEKGELRKPITVDIEQATVLDEGAVKPKPPEHRTNGPMPEAIRR